MRPKRRLPEEIEVLELNEYIQAFKSSSDRVRYVVFLITFVSLLIFIATWNLQQWSWSRHRMDLAEKPLEAALAAEFEKRYPVPTVATAESRPTTKAEWDKRRRDFIIEGVRRDRARAFRPFFIERGILIPIPGLGIVVDVNDIGILGGVVLSIIALILCFSMVRQHENLHLAFFKIRRLCERDRNKHDGESLANFLYHALAMGQVLNYPPTLARWRFGIRNGVVELLRLTVFLIPLIVQSFVLWTNWRTRGLAVRAWGETTTYARLGVQIALVLILGLLLLMTAIYSYAGTRRWRGAFYLINPGLKIVEPRPWLEWVKVRSGPPAPLRPILTELSYTVNTGREEDLIGEEVIYDELEGESRVISQKRLLKMSSKLHEKLLDRLEALKANHGWTSVTPIRYRAEENRLDPLKWRVALRCYYRYTRPAETGVSASPTPPASPPPPPSAGRIRSALRRSSR